MHECDTINQLRLLALTLADNISLAIHVQNGERDLPIGSESADRGGFYLFFYRNSCTDRESFRLEVEINFDVPPFIAFIILRARACAHTKYGWMRGRDGACSNGPILNIL